MFNKLQAAPDKKNQELFSIINGKANSDKYMAKIACQIPNEG